MKKPSIYDYLDVTQYLVDYLTWKKSLHSEFSIAQWASELGVINKVTLRFILKKQRTISAATAKRLEMNLNLTGDEAAYFANLVEYSQAKSVTEKQAVGAMLIKLQRKQFQQVSVPCKTASRHHFTPVVLTLLTFTDIVKNAATLSRLLNLDEETAQKILSELEADGLITRSADATYYFSETTFRIPANPNLKAFYEYWIDRAKEALAMPYEVRRYRALKFALTPEEFNEIVEKMNEYSMVLLSQYQSSQLEGRRLYMYETAVFPISRGMEKQPEPLDKETETKASDLPF
ncbi:hypothetical protein D3C87_90300 [compost metagenome]